MAKRKTPSTTRTQPAPRRKSDRFVIAYVHPGQTSAYFTHSLTGLCMVEALRGRIENVIQEWSSANISSSRNELVRRFLADHKADWLLFIDADMAFDPESYEALVDVADVKRAPIVGGLCFGSSFGRLFPTLYHFVKTDTGVTTMRAEEVPFNSMVRVDATGAAFLMIHRTVLEAIRDRAFNPTFPWFQETELAAKPAGEDVTFCIRAGICGFPVYVHTGVAVGHHKSQLLTLDLFNEQKAVTVDGEPSAVRDA